jgi:hypothetical protein
MALNTGINSLDTGAPGVRLTGDQRPQKESPFNVPEEMKMADIDNLPPWFLEDLQDLMLDYEGDIGSPPRTLNDLEKWYRNKHGARVPEKGITAAAQGGRIGYDTGGNIRQQPHQSRDLLAKKNPDGIRSKYQWPGPGGGAPEAGGGGGHDPGGTRDPRPGGGDPRMTYTAPPVETRVSAGQSVAMVGDTHLAGLTHLEAENRMAAEKSVAVSDADLLGLASGADLSGVESVATKRPTEMLDIAGTVTPTAATTLVDDYSTQDLEEQLAIDLGEPTAQFTPEERDQQGYGTPTITDYEGEAYGTPDTMKGPIYTGTEDAEEQAEKDLEWALKFGIKEKDPITGEIGEGPNIRDLDTGVIGTKPEPTITTGGEGEGPIVPDTTTTVPVETPEDTGLTAEENAALAAAYGFGENIDTRFQDVPYPEYGLGAFTPTVTAPQISFASRGGRAGYDQGGIAGARQGYFVGDLVKKITGGAKKILKSPVGKLAAIAGLGAYGLGAGPFAGMAGSGFLKGEMIKKLLLKEGAKKWSMANIAPWKATAAIAGISSIPLWAKPENWDEMDQAEQEAWLKEYHSKVAAFKEDYGGEMPVQLTKAADLPHQFSAEGGRIGLKDGRSVREAALRAMYGDEDEEENTGIKQLFSDTWRAAKGGRIGYQQGAQVDPRMKQSYKENLAMNDARREINQAMRGQGATGTTHGKGALDQLYKKYGIFGTQYSGWGGGTTQAPEYSGILSGQRENLEREISGKILGGGYKGTAEYERQQQAARERQWAIEDKKQEAENKRIQAATTAAYGKPEDYEFQAQLLGGMNPQAYYDYLVTGNPKGIAELGEGQSIPGHTPYNVYYEQELRRNKQMGLPTGQQIQHGQVMQPGGIPFIQPGQTPPTTPPSMYSPYADAVTAQKQEWDIMYPQTHPKYQTYQSSYAAPDPSTWAPYQTWLGQVPYNQGGRVAAQEGGLMNLGGMEKDYRQEGGFVPIGGQEKADDVPARLSKNEFVFTADAVRAAGGGDIDAGAEVMENVMENLEAGGKVSEESQGLEGARNMFATSQQLEKRII